MLRAVVLFGRYLVEVLLERLTAFGEVGGKYSELGQAFRCGGDCFDWDKTRLVRHARYIGERAFYVFAAVEDVLDRLGYRLAFFVAYLAENCVDIAELGYVTRRVQYDAVGKVAKARMLYRQTVTEKMQFDGRAHRIVVDYLR